MTDTSAHMASGKPVEYYRERIRDLGRVIDTANCERELAMFRAHQRGATREELARLAQLDPVAVQHTLDSLAAEPDIDEWYDGPDWVRLYPERW